MLVALLTSNSTDDFSERPGDPEYDSIGDGESEVATSIRGFVAVGSNKNRDRNRNRNKDG